MSLCYFQGILGLIQNFLRSMARELLGAKDAAIHNSLDFNLWKRGSGT
jgi:DNA polymerase IIIc chi subunit